MNNVEYVHCDTYCALDSNTIADSMVAPFALTRRPSVAPVAADSAEAVVVAEGRCNPLVPKSISGTEVNGLNRYGRGGGG
jgi:hypothetical protein